MARGGAGWEAMARGGAGWEAMARGGASLETMARRTSSAPIIVTPWPCTSKCVSCNRGAHTDRVR